MNVVAAENHESEVVGALKLKVEIRSLTISWTFIIISMCYVHVFLESIFFNLREPNSIFPKSQSDFKIQMKQ